MLKYTPTFHGLPEILNNISLEDVVKSLKIHISHFHLDTSICHAYINRILSDKNLLNSKETVFFLQYLCKKLIQLDPFEASAWRILSQIGLEGHDIDTSKKICALYQKHSQDIDRLANKISGLNTHAALDTVLSHLKKNNCPFVADMALSQTQDNGGQPEDWINEYIPPKDLVKEWDKRLFLHYCYINNPKSALKIWERIEKHVQEEEVYLNYAAECFIQNNDLEMGRKLYLKSLKLDPLQEPMRRRLDSLGNGPGISPIQNRSFNIYLYSYNKARILESTLYSLHNSNIGTPRIRLLLNGCTDDSEQVARNGYEIFPECDYDYIKLPVNIGAPAARNWLVSQEETFKREFTAFLDDDVTIPEDWLERFTACMDKHPDAGVVGCKVLYPGTPYAYQYLFRCLSFTTPDITRLSPATPSRQYDNGFYDIIRSTSNVMGCCHMFSQKALQSVPDFDIRFSPSQLDDIAHDLELKLKGFDVLYCGKVACIHHQNSGVGAKSDINLNKIGNTMGNYMKFHFKFTNRIKGTPIGHE